MGYFGGIFPVNINFESGFTGFRGLHRTSSVWVLGSFVEYYFIPSFSPMRNASAKGLEMKTPSDNNLPTQTEDVIVNPRNPVNPDSKPHAVAPVISWEEGQTFFVLEVKVL